MNTLTKATVIAGVFAVLITTGYAYSQYHTAMQTTPADTIATTTPAQSDTLGYGTVTLALGELASFKNISIRPTALVEDSRCPSNVQCIQAGTVRVRVDVGTTNGTSTSILTLSKLFTTEGMAITLTSVTPGKISTRQYTDAEYRFTFTVMPQTTAPAPSNPKGKCYVGGCSAQVCSDSPNIVSTCEYRAEYACYKTATCERQTSGECGWTQTASLTMCLAHPPQM